jgi:hypothetical protein
VQETGRWISQALVLALALALALPLAQALPLALPLPLALALALAQGCPPPSWPQRPTPRFLRPRRPPCHRRHGG